MFSQPRYGQVIVSVFFLRSNANNISLIAQGTKLGGTCVNVGCVPKKVFVSNMNHHPRQLVWLLPCDKNMYCGWAINESG